MERGFKTWAEQEAVAARKRLGLNSRERLPARALLRSLGAVVTWPSLIPGMSSADIRQLTATDPSGWSAVTAQCYGTTVVIVNDAHSRARQESNLHHEASHILRGHDPCELVRVGNFTLRLYDEIAEEEASWLAGCLHLPRPALLSAFRMGHTEAAIGASYVASAEMVRFRRSVTGIDRQIRSRR